MNKATTTLRRYLEARKSLLKAAVITFGNGSAHFPRFRAALPLQVCGRGSEAQGQGGRHFNCHIFRFRFFLFFLVVLAQLRRIGSIPTKRGGCMTGGSAAGSSSSSSS